jgi:hypothetical protein
MCLTCQPPVLAKQGTQAGIFRKGKISFSITEQAALFFTFIRTVRVLLSNDYGNTGCFHEFFIFFPDFFIYIARRICSLTPVIFYR